MHRDPLAELFCSNLDGALREEAQERADLDAWLADMFTRAHAGFPHIALTPEQFIPFVAERCPPDASLDTLATLLHLDQLCLVCACVNGDAEALAELERRYFPSLERTLSRLAQGDLEPGDFLQRMRMSLFVADGRSAKILQYSGRGDLGRWLRVVALRTAFNARETRRELSQAALPDFETLESAPVSATGLELEYMRRLYNEIFTAAMEEAFASMPPELAQVLRWYHAEGKKLREIATELGSNIPTVSRRLEHARTALVGIARKRLTQKLGVGSVEAASILRLIRSRFEISSALFRCRKGE